jgi:hypothetical protein
MRDDRARPLGAGLAVAPRMIAQGRRPLGVKLRRYCRAQALLSMGYSLNGNF